MNRISSSIITGIPVILAAVMAQPGAVLAADEKPRQAKLAETAWTLRVAFEDDVSKSVLDGWCRRMQAASDLIFRLTEGQIHFAACSVEDKTSIGDFVVLSGLTRENLIKEADAMALTLLAGTPVWLVHTAGEPDGGEGWVWTLGTVVVHEIGHGAFGLPDERNTAAAMGMECPNCIMGTDPTKLCGPGTHSGSFPKSCKETISALYGGKVKFPNPAWREKTPEPKTKFTVTDRGKKDLGPEMQPLAGKDLQAVQELRRLGRAFDVTVAFEGQAAPDLQLRWKRGILLMDRILRRITAGQFIIATCSIECGKSEGTFVIEKGSEAQSLLASNPQAMWGKKGDGWVCAGVVPAEGLARYAFAEWLKIQESGQECKCYLNLGDWAYPYEISLCRRGEHKGEGKSCEELLADEWKDRGVVAPSAVNKQASLPCTRFKMPK